VDIIQVRVPSVVNRPWMVDVAMIPNLCMRESGERKAIAFER